MTHEEAEKKLQSSQWEDKIEAMNWFSENVCPDCLGIEFCTCGEVK